MTAIVVSPKKSTNVRQQKWRPSLRRLLMAGYSALLPDHAARLFERLFLTPRRRAGPVAADGPFAPGRARRLPYAGRWLRVWETGAGEEAVILVHGWAGQAGQMAAFAEPLTAAGLRVLGFDAPAHGLSDGDRTDMIDFAGAVLQVAGQSGPVRGVVAHSFGAPAVALALAHGLKLDRLVCVAPPNSLEQYSLMVSRFAGVPERVRARMQRRVERRFGIAWRELETTRMLAGAHARRPFELMVVHDWGDRQVSWSSGALVAGSVPGARMHTTGGLGHNKPLRDPATVREIAAFLSAGRG